MGLGHRVALSVYSKQAFTFASRKKENGTRQAVTSLRKKKWRTCSTAVGVIRAKTFNVLHGKKNEMSAYKLKVSLITTRKGAPPRKGCVGSSQMTGLLAPRGRCCT